MSEAHRLHPAIPLSPPSPPADGVREGQRSHAPDCEPHSPASPFMSVATKSYGQSFAQSSASSAPTAAQRSPSPPASAPMSTQVSQQPSMTATTSLSTPDNSVIGQARKVPDEFNDEYVSKRQRLDTGITGKGDQVDHEFKSPLSSFQQEEQIGSQLSCPDSTAIRHSSAEGTQTHSAADEMTQPAPVEMSLEQLQKNVGEAFHLCKSAIPRIRPDPSQHLLSRFGLSDLHAKVARTHPITHEKINRLRRSYEGQIKNFALAGRNKPTKDEISEGQWSSLNMMMLEPEESWYASKVMGKKIEVTPGLEARLHEILVLQPGRTKDHEQWENLLGHERPKGAQMPEQAGRRAVASTTTRPELNGKLFRPQSQTASEAARPRRSGKKRSYADNSFEGYGDGFVDDEAVDVDQNLLSNSEDGSLGPGRKKRKKENPFSDSATLYAGPASYGVGAWNGAGR